MTTPKKAMAAEGPGSESLQRGTAQEISEHGRGLRRMPRHEAESPQGHIRPQRLRGPHGGDPGRLRRMPRASKRGNILKTSCPSRLKNLDDNLLYQDLQHSILGKPVLKDGDLVMESASNATLEEGCYYCHGTKIEVGESKDAGHHDGRDGLPNPFRLAQPGRRTGESRRKPRVVQRLPHPPRVFHGNGPQALYLRGMPCRPRRSRLQGVHLEQAREYFFVP